MAEASTGRSFSGRRRSKLGADKERGQSGVSPTHSHIKRRCRGDKLVAEFRNAIFILENWAVGGATRPNMGFRFAAIFWHSRSAPKTAEDCRCYTPTPCPAASAHDLNHLPPLTSLRARLTSFRARLKSGDGRRDAGGTPALQKIALESTWEVIFGSGKH
jgi:hypothetical protein